MGFGSIPEIAYHFITAVEHAAPHAKLAAERLYEGGINVVVAATDPDAMSRIDRNIQFAKLGSASFGLCVAVLKRNVQGGISCTVAIGETLMRLDKAGAKARHPSL